MGPHNGDCQMPIRLERLKNSPAYSGTEQAAMPRSPACSMHEADDVYMGYADQTEVIAFLNERLEAECLGAEVTRQAAHEVEGRQSLDLLQEIRQDQAVSCALLSRHIPTRHATVSSQAGEFHEKALASGDARRRLIFLNQGQMAAIRDLQAMLRRVRDDALHADLTNILRLHEANVRRVDAVLNLLEPDRFRASHV
jgi:Domain of unknown function (DUF6306)